MGKTVLVTAIGSFAADAVIRNLKELGYRVLGCDIYAAEWVAQSAEVDRFVQIPPVREEEAYLKAMKELLKEEAVDFLLPLIDVEIDVLNRVRDELEAAGTVVCISPKEVIGQLRDKQQFSKAAKAVLKKLGSREGGEQVRVIPTKLASRVDYEKLQYPIVLKPADGRSSIGLYQVYHEDQLGFAFSCIEDPNKLNDTALDHYLVQPLIKGNVVTVDVVRDRKGQVITAPREELLRTPNGAGTSVRVFQDEVLQSVCSRLAEGMGILGCVNFELIRGEGSGIYYLLECNPRFSGGVAFSEMSGFPAVAAHMSVFDNEGMSEEMLAAAQKLQCGHIARKYVECRM